MEKYLFTLSDPKIPQMKGKIPPHQAPAGYVGLYVGAVGVHVGTNVGYALVGAAVGNQPVKTINVADRNCYHF